MTAVKAGEVEGLIRRGPDPRCFLLLVYGPDAGLVEERARHLAQAAVDDPADPFQFIRLEGDDVAADAGRLADEAGTMGLFGGRRALWIRAGQRNLAPAVEAVLDQGRSEARIVVEAGDLGRSAPLRSLCERSPHALALPCYADGAGDLAALVDATLREAGLRIGREVRQALVESLGGDRRASRNEIEKLALYAQGDGEVTFAHLDAIVGDVSGLAQATLIDDVFGGRIADAEDALRRFRAEGFEPSVLLGTGLRHALSLLSARVGIGGGQTPAAALAAWRGLSFQRQKAVGEQLRRWTAPALREAIASLQAGVLACRRAGAPLAHATAAEALLRIAAGAARR